MDSKIKLSPRRPKQKLLRKKTVAEEYLVNKISDKMAEKVEEVINVATTQEDSVQTFYARSSLNNTVDKQKPRRNELRVASPKGPIELSYFPYLKNRTNLDDDLPSTNHKEEILSNRLNLALQRLESTEKSRDVISKNILKKQQSFSRYNDKVSNYVS